jgi:hypothetical protein
MTTKSVIHSPLMEALNVNPVIAAILSATAGFMAEYQSLIQGAFFTITLLISVVTFFNKSLDTYWRVRKWLAKRKRK